MAAHRKNTKKGPSSPHRCEKCGFIKHGKNHDEGDHHKKGSGGSMAVGKNAR